jgi:D,D-heptose 1,7-bisphosphate phosphatase
MKSSNRAIFLDRDGVVNKLIYHQEHGIIDSPFTVEQYELLPRVGEAIKEFHEMGYLVVLVSNQPGIAKGHYTAETFEKIRAKMKQELERKGAYLDNEYYCLHHPEATVAGYRTVCECRKPKPGLLTRASEEMQIDLSRSWMIGDGLTDIIAGKAAGTRTMLIGNMKCELCRMMDELNARPDALSPSLDEAVQIIYR